MQRSLPLSLRLWSCVLFIGLGSLLLSGCSVQFPLSLLTLLVRNDTAPDAGAVLLARPSQPAKPIQPQAEMIELSSVKVYESLSHWYTSAYASGSRETTFLSWDRPGSMVRVSERERKPCFDTVRR